MTTVASSPAPNTPDLRQLAVEALTDLAYGGKHLTKAHAGHLVDAVLAAVLPEHRRQVAEAIAYDIRAELVCCDIYDKDADTDWAGTHHPICFWGEAAARLAEDHGEGTPERLLMARLHVDPTAAARSRSE